VLRFVPFLPLYDALVTHAVQLVASSIKWAVRSEPCAVCWDVCFVMCAASCVLCAVR